jgi:hypothetical protein
VPATSKRITASQVGQYVYCAHAWWLGVVEGYEPADVEAIDAGTQAHQHHGWQVTLARASRKLALVLLAAAALALAAWALRLGR